MTAARIVDVRLVLDREGHTRAIVDGRPVLTFACAAEALSVLAACIEHVPPAEQIEALRAPSMGSDDGSEAA